MTARVEILAWFCLAALGCSSAPHDAPEVEVSWNTQRLGAPGPLTVDLRLRGAEGQPLSGAQLLLEANMTHAGMAPVWVQPSEVEPGRYRASLALGMAGDWYLLLEGSLADGRRLERRLDLPAQ